MDAQVWMRKHGFHEYRAAESCWGSALPDDLLSDMFSTHQAATNSSLRATKEAAYLVTRL